MSMIYDSRDQLFAAGGIASETTAATFVTGASNKEVKLLQEDGTAAAGAGDTFFAAYKDNKGVVHTSPYIVPENITSYKKTSAQTAVPAYSYFEVDTTGMAADDLLTIFGRVYGLGTGSSMDQIEVTFGVTFETGDTSATLANKIGIAAYNNFASEYKISASPTTVYNKAGYAKIYETSADYEDADFANDASDDGSLVWVINEAKPYTYTYSDGTWANDFAEKTDWSSEITAETAVEVPSVKYYDFVQLDDTNDSIYLIAKEVAQDDERFSGTSSITKFSAVWYDDSNSYAKGELDTTYVFETVNLGAGKRLRNKEVSLDFNHRPYGRFEVAGEDPVLNIDVDTDYYVVDIAFKVQDDNTNNQLVKTKANYHLTIACTSSGDADTLISAIDTIVG